MATSAINRVIQHLRKTVLLREGADLTDGQLLASFVSRREAAALEVLVQRHAPMVWGVCRRILQRHHDAEDAFQATFLVLVRRAASITPREMVANWLYGVAHQTALKARATRAIRKGRERQVKNMPEPEAVERQDLWTDLRPMLDQELSRLPDKYRVAIVLCDLEGKSRKETARQLGLPEGTLAGRLTRGRAMLAKRLARNGVVLSSGSLAAVLTQKVASGCVPHSLMNCTIKAATSIAAGQVAATGLVSAKAVVLTEGVLKAMLLSKLKTVGAMLFVVLGLVTFGGRLLEHQRATGQQVEAIADEKPINQKADTPKAAPAEAAPPKGVASYRAVFDAAIGVLSDYFVIEDSDAYAGRIETFPALVKVATEKAASEPSIRRQAIIQFTPASDGTFLVQICVFKEVERKARPMSRETTWEPIGRDNGLEQAILKRLTAQYINVKQNGEPFPEAVQAKKAADIPLGTEVRDKGKLDSEQAKSTICGEVLKVGVDELLVFLVVETDRQIVYLTTEDKKKGDVTYRITNKTIVLRGDSMKRLRFADVRTGSRISIELDKAKSSVRQIVVLKDRLGVFGNSEVITINTHTFKIPIQIASERRNEIKRVALHVSRDGGDTWVMEQVKTLADIDDGFSVTMPTDGFYWFAVQTESGNGVVEPEANGFQAWCLKVRVDTSKAR
jgi:RNA polymerase sigma factor (sigma-70 family)